MQSVAVIDPAALRVLVRETVAAALAEHDGRPALLDRQRLAAALCVSASHVDQLRRRGLPTVDVGGCPRFDLSAVLAWLAAMNAAG